MAKQRECLNCEGRGTVLLENSWFVDDGYRRERCAVCAGSGFDTSGYQPPQGHAEYLKTANARIKLWKALRPSART